MAETDNNSQQQADSKSLASIKAVQGRVLVTQADGSAGVAAAGQSLSLGDLVQARGSSTAILDFGDKGLVTLGHDEVVKLDQALLRLLEQREEEGSLEEGVNFEALAQAIEEGRDIDEVLPATAAGDGDDRDVGESASSGPVRLQLTADQVTPTSGFETSGLTNAALTTTLPLGDQISEDFLLAQQASNNQPTATQLASVSVDEDESFELDISPAFSDADDGQTLTFDIEGLPDSLSFDPATGTITGTPTNDDAFSQGGIYTITVTATDDSGESNNSVTTQFELQVNNVNDAPTVDAPVALESIDEDTSLTFSGQDLLDASGAGDIDLNDTLSVTNVVLTAGNGQITQNADGSFVFTPDPDWNGDVAISFDVIDGNGGSVSNTATFAVDPVNDAPVALPDGPVSTTTNSPVDIDLLANDTDVDGDTLTITSATAQNGTVTINDDGTVTYTPNDGFSGEDEIVYEISDGQGGVAQSTASINVIFSPATVTLADTGTIDDPTPIFSGTVDNVVGDLTLEVNGNTFTVTPNADGTWIFELPDAFALPDGEFIVTVTGLDELGNEVSASDPFTVDALLPEVTISDLQVIGDTTPTFSGTSANTDGDFTLTVNGIDYTVTPNDDGTWTFTIPDTDALPDGDFTATISVSDAAGNTASASDDFTVSTIVPNEDPVAESFVGTTDEDTALNGQLEGSDAEGDVTFAVVGTPPAGLALNPDGSFVFTPGDEFDALNESESQDVVFTFSVTDEDGVSVEETATITVTGTNDAPVAELFTGTTDEDTALSGQLVGSDAEGDVTFAVVGTPPTGLALNPDGSFVFTPGDEFDALNEGDSQDVVFTFSVTDENGVSVEETATITVTGNSGSPVAELFTGTTDEDTPLNGQLVGSDAEGDVTFAVVGTTPAGLVLNPDGSFVFTPGDEFDALNEGEIQDVVFTFSVTDSDGASVEETATITVTGTNDAPVAELFIGTTDEDTALNGQLVGSDAEGDVTFAVEGTPPAGLVLNPDGSFVFTPGDEFDALNEGDSQDVVFTFSVTDENGVSVEETATITVTGTNDAPVAELFTGTTDEDTALNGQLVGSDAEGDVTFAVVGTPPAGLALNPDGSFVFTPGDEFDALNEGDSQDVVFTFSVTDENGVSVEETATITVTGTNDAPVAELFTGTTDEDTALNGQLVGSDAEGDVTFAVVGTPPAGLALNPDGSFVFTPGDEFDALNEGDSQDVVFTFSVTDENGVSVEETATITVTGTNDAPVAELFTGTTDEDTALNGQLVGSDAEGDVTFAVVGTPPAGLALNPDGSFVFTPGDEFDALNEGDSEDVVFTFSVTDENGVSVEETATITVTGTNDAPVAELFTGTTDEDTPLSGQLVGSDAEGDVTFAVEGDTPDGLVLNDDGSFVFTPSDTEFGGLNDGESESVEFTFSVTDEDGVSVTETATITVEGVDDPLPPVITVADGDVVQESQFSIVEFPDDVFPEDLDGPGDANGLNPDNVTLTGVNEVTLTFVSESAGFGNSVGIFQVNGDGQLVGAQVIWEDGNAVSPGDTFTLTTESDTQLGFFIIPNGAVSFDDELEALANGEGFIRFEDENGDLATVDTDGATLVFHTEGDEFAPAGESSSPSTTTFLSGPSNLNPDGSTRVASGLANAADPTTLLIGFEDLTDFDLTDFVFSLEIQSSDINVSDIAPDLSIADDGQELVSAQAQITLGRAGDELLLSGTLLAQAEAAGLTVAIDTDAGSLSITGNADIDVFTELLAGVQISNVDALGDDPREITFTVVDSDGLSSNLATVQLNADPTYDFADDDLVVSDGGVVTGGAGSDILIASDETDIFAFNDGDQGTTDAPARDVIRDFELGAGGDVLDFSDLLQGESDDPATLDAFLDFSFDGNDTTISISADGSGDVTQEVTLEGVDLTLLGSNDQLIIQQLLSDGNLATD